MRLAIAIAAGFAAIVACQGADPSAPQPRPDFKALDWISDAADPVAHLTLQPATCLTAPHDPAVQRGELLFNSPLLLGGQAAKAGLSCASCHRNGRGNPDFVFAGLSSGPGTADVTSGLFSKVRADQIFNPVVIPDLAAPEGHVLVDRGAEGALEMFLAAQITEEFSGTVPTGPVVADLAAYIRALDLAACDGAPEQVQTWQDETRRLRAGAAYLASEPAGDQSAYRLAMRAALGRLYERYPETAFGAEAQDLVSLGRELSLPDISSAALAERLDALEADLQRGERQSLYNAEQLARALR